MKKKKKPIGNGNYTVCRKCRGTGVTAETKKADNRHGQAILIVDCPNCRDSSGNSRGWVDAER